MIEVYIDGASAGDPGPSGAGIFIKGLNKGVERHSIPLGVMSNHEAEYFSLIKALEICVEGKYTMVSFRTDSLLVEQAVNKRYAKKKQFQHLLDESLRLIDRLDLFFIKWIPNSQNKQADELARKAIQPNKGQQS